MKKKAGYYAFIVLAGVIILAALSFVKVPNSNETLLAQVGVVVGVQPNPYNTLNQQLNEKAAQLNAQQAYLNEEQAAIASSTSAGSSSSSDLALWYLAAAVAVVAALAVFDFYIEWRMAKKLRNIFRPPQDGSRSSSPPPAP